MVVRMVMKWGANCLGRAQVAFMGLEAGNTDARGPIILQIA